MLSGCAPLIIEYYRNFLKLRYSISVNTSILALGSDIFGSFGSTEYGIEFRGIGNEKRKREKETIPLV